MRSSEQLPSSTALAAERELTSNRQLWFLIGLTLVAAALRLVTIDVQSFWLDEAYTVSLVRRDFFDMLSQIPVSESTPPFYYILAWLWTNVFGHGEIGLRSLSAVFGTATVPVVYLVARRVAGVRAGLIAAALTVVNPLLVWYSQEGRAYALMVLLGALSILFFIEALQSPRRAVWIRWTVVSALALATHYFAVFLIAAEIVWLFVAMPKLRRTLVIASTPVVLVGAALVPLAIKQQGHGGAKSIARLVDLKTRVAQVPKQFLIGFDAPAEELLAVLAAAMVAVGIWLLLRRAAPRTRRSVLPLVFVGAVAVAAPLILALITGVDYLNSRNVLTAWPPLACVVAAGFAVRHGRKVGIASFAVLCFISLLTVISVAVRPEFQRDDWRSAVGALGSAKTDRAIVATPAHASLPLSVYLPGARYEGSKAVQVEEVIVIGLPIREVGEASNSPEVKAIPIPGFEVVESLRERGFTLVRYRSKGPTDISTDILREGRLSSDWAAIFIEKPVPSKDTKD